MGKEREEEGGNRNRRKEEEGQDDQGGDKPAATCRSSGSSRMLLETLDVTDAAWRSVRMLQNWGDLRAGEVYFVERSLKVSGRKCWQLIDGCKIRKGRIRKQDSGSVWEWHVAP